MKKKLLISETNRAEREKLVAEANAVSSLAIDSPSNVSPRLQELYQKYINGDLELEEIDKIHSQELDDRVRTLFLDHFTKEQQDEIKKICGLDDIKQLPLRADIEIQCRAYLDLGEITPEEAIKIIKESYERD